MLSVWSSLKRPLNDQRPLRENTIGVINTVTKGKLSAGGGGRIIIILFNSHNKEEQRDLCSLYRQEN